MWSAVAPDTSGDASPWYRNEREWRSFARIFGHSLDNVSIVRLTGGAGGSSSSELAACNHSEMSQADSVYPTFSPTPDQRCNGSHWYRTTASRLQVRCSANPQANPKAVVRLCPGGMSAMGRKRKAVCCAATTSVMNTLAYRTHPLPLTRRTG